MKTTSPRTAHPAPVPKRPRTKRAKSKSARPDRLESFLSALLPAKGEASVPEPLWGVLSEEAIDRQIHAAIARLTFGLSPASLALAYGDWALHMAASPGKRAKLAQKALRKALRFWL
ncbi:MAG: poly-beta-hydroxybutyrate polymerase N-terminal domain-containing protein, partial [Hyphomicrobiales bacterium]|nr:poly-beta-hydroxybutyrate polymerase N-terminal domain-containing protein [Hyphomicrobiales bacterium]